MTLLQVLNMITDIASGQPNINTVLKSGDIYDLNNEDYEIKYSVFCATQQTHTFADDFFHFNFTLYYVDRLTSDQNNKNEVQSTAINVLTNVFKQIQQNIDFDVIGSDITTFTQKFTALCAGAYLNIEIVTAQNSLC